MWLVIAAACLHDVGVVLAAVVILDNMTAAMAEKSGLRHWSNGKHIEFIADNRISGSRMQVPGRRTLM